MIGPDPLTPRERRLLRLVVAGLPVSEIAATLGCSVVELHRMAAGITARLRLPVVEPERRFGRRAA